MAEKTDQKDTRPDDNINYTDAVSYWASVPATVDGVLGGYGEKTPVPKADVSGSMGFIRRLAPTTPLGEGEVKYALDVGAGYVKHLNLLYFSSVAF